MLNDEYLQKLSKPIIDNIEKINQYVLQQVGSTLKKIKNLKQSDIYKLELILKYGGDYQKIVKETKKITKLNLKQIDQIFEQAAKQDYQFAKQFYDYRKTKYIPYQQNKQLQNQIKAVKNQTKKTYANLSKTKAIGFGFKDSNGKIIFTSLEKSYYKLIDQSILAVSQGKQTYQQMMSKIIRDVGTGLKVIYKTKQKDGSIKYTVRRLDSAIRMNIRDGLRQLHNQTQQVIAKQIDADGVEITVHSNPAPDHEKVQGKQFSIEQFNNFQNDKDAVSYDGVEFPAISEETHHDRRSISEYNCYHFTFAIILGVNKPQYNNQALQKIIDRNNKGFEFDGKHYTNYQGTQLQRQIETKIRDLKDQQIFARQLGEKDEVIKIQNKISILNRKYKSLCQASGLPPKANRMSVVGYKHINYKS